MSRHFLIFPRRSAPRGTCAGVSGFQVQFSSHDIFTPGDRLNALVAMNPAALVTNISDLERGGILVVNEDGFNDKELRLANLATNPLEDHSLDEYRVFRVPMTTLTRKAVEELGLSVKIGTAVEISSPWGWCIGCSAVTFPPP